MRIMKGLSYVNVKQLPADHNLCLSGTSSLDGTSPIELKLQPMRYREKEPRLNRETPFFCFGSVTNA